MEGSFGLAHDGGIVSCRTPEAVRDLQSSNFGTERKEDLVDSAQGMGCVEIEGSGDGDRRREGEIGNALSIGFPMAGNTQQVIVLCANEDSVLIEGRNNRAGSVKAGLVQGGAERGGVDEGSIISGRHTSKAFLVVAEHVSTDMPKIRLQFAREAWKVVAARVRGGWRVTNCRESRQRFRGRKSGEGGTEIR